MYDPTEVTIMTELIKLEGGVDLKVYEGARCVSIVQLKRNDGGVSALTHVRDDRKIERYQNIRQSV